MNFDDTNLKYVKITIQDQKELYRFKNTLIELGLKFTAAKKIYSNENELSQNAIDDIMWFCQKNEYKYTVEDVVIKDKVLIVKSSYSLVVQDKCTYFIQSKSSNKKIIAILIYDNEEKSMINFIDISSGKQFNISIVLENKLSRLLEICNLLISKQNDLKEVDFEIERLIYLLSILIDKQEAEYSKNEKLIKFKNMIISQIKKNAQDGFLCNCVDGFYPEIEFHVRGEKIVSSLTNNTISFEQELKVMKYLMKPENKKYIGNIKNPSLMELFYNNKITINLNGFETKVLIKRIEEIGSMIKISIFEGNRIIKLNNHFTKEQLLEYVYKAR